MTNCTTVYTPAISAKRIMVGMTKSQEIADTGDKR